MGYVLAKGGVPLVNLPISQKNNNLTPPHPRGRGKAVKYNLISCPYLLYEVSGLDWKGSSHVLVLVKAAE